MAYYILMNINDFFLETMSEQSDMEVRISVLKEQLRQRKLEAEKLRREQTRAQREKLKAKEQSLLKQIQVIILFLFLLIFCMIVYSSQLILT